MNLYSPALQLTIAANAELAHTGPVPTLSQASRCYGAATVMTILCFQMEDLNCFAGAKTKLEVYLQKEVAKIILVEFYYLKISEVLLFFYRMKSGSYGPFYGVIDAMQILVSLRVFINERQAVLERYEAECRRQQQEEARKQTSENCVTYEQYLEIKRQKEEQQEVKQTIKQD